MPLFTAKTRRKHSPLPWDVVILIVQNVPVAKLYPLLLASRSLKEAAEAVLYHHIDLTNCAIRSLFLFRTLLASARHCELIRSFHPATENTDNGTAAIVARTLMQASAFDRFRKSPTMEDRLGSGVDVSNRLVNIRDLTLQAYNFPELKPNNLPRLQQLSLVQPRSVYYCPDLDLNVLPGLTHLEIPTESFRITLWQSSNVLPLLEDSLRKLETLACPLSEAVRIVPGRPIKRLFVTTKTYQHPPTPLEVMAAIGQSTEKITVLGMALGWDWQEVLSKLLSATARFCPDLEEWHLKIDFAALTEDMMAPFMQDLPSILSVLKSLRVFNLQGTTGNVIPCLDSKHHPAPVYLHSLEQWSMACPTLREVVFSNGSVWAYEEATMQWQRRTTGRVVPWWARDEVSFYERMEYLRLLSKPMFGKDLRRAIPGE